MCSKANAHASSSNTIWPINDVACRRLFRLHNTESKRSDGHSGVFRLESSRRIIAFFLGKKHQPDDS